jgi:hypothetical protein
MLFSHFKNPCETQVYKYTVNPRRNVLLRTCTQSYVAAVNVCYSECVKKKCLNSNGDINR